MEETGCEVICGAPTIPAVKGWVKGEGFVESCLLAFFIFDHVDEAFAF